MNIYTLLVDLKKYYFIKKYKIDSNEEQMKHYG